METKSKCPSCNKDEPNILTTTSCSTLCKCNCHDPYTHKIIPQDTEEEWEIEFDKLFYIILPEFEYAKNDMYDQRKLFSHNKLKGFIASQIKLAYEKGQEETKKKWTEMYGKCIDTYENILKDTRTSTITEIREKVLKLVTDEIAIAHKENTTGKTSRLTSLYMKIINYLDSLK